MQKKNLLITGAPGSGKTTLIRALADPLRGLHPAGFYTAEIREEERMVGFCLVGLDGRREILAHRDIGGPYRVGRYGVDLERFEEFLAAISLFDPGTGLIVIDEIGKMECFSAAFRHLIREALDSTVPCIATIAQKGGRDIERVKAREDVRIVTVTRKNRTALLPVLLEEVRRMAG
ncbi:putative atp-binding protein [hydrocarbon metagenome]|uniref:Putative atp-binding protein n=1 Tax=hydrocarbon metagenome TaxID=938273 RepID=A0A0W8FIG3_9ZZZZ